VDVPSSSLAKLPLLELFEYLNPKHSRVAHALFEDYQTVFTSIPGSKTKHQAWPGGYLSHIEEAMNIGLILYKSLAECRKLSFDLSSVLFCIYMHDFDKVQRYSLRADGILQSIGNYDKTYLEKTAQILQQQYDYVLTDEEHNALKYAHGEGDDYHPTERIMNPLATIVHCADVISARVWFDEGRSHDAW
jgi:23S rRNA maturation-related 3'-5' exoribonuclease YhaM